MGYLVSWRPKSGQYQGGTLEVLVSELEIQLLENLFGVERNNSSTSKSSLNVFFSHNLRVGGDKCREEVFLRNVGYVSP